MDKWAIHMIQKQSLDFCFWKHILLGQRAHSKNLCVCASAFPSPPSSKNLPLSLPSIHATPRSISNPPPSPFTFSLSLTLPTSDIPKRTQPRQTSTPPHRLSFPPFPATHIPIKLPFWCLPRAKRIVGFGSHFPTPNAAIETNRVPWNGCEARRSGFEEIKVVVGVYY